MKKFIPIVFASMVCNSQPKEAYPNHTGDIAFEAKTDNNNFFLCSESHIFQYFNDSNGLEYEGEKLAIETEFAKNFDSPILKGETGSIRIRFVVNCKGETDRFRLIAMDENYSDKVFPVHLTDRLMQITKNLKGWKTKKYDGREIDYYQYLIFKIEDGQLKEILP